MTNMKGARKAGPSHPRERARRGRVPLRELAEQPLTFGKPAWTGPEIERLRRAGAELGKGLATRASLVSEVDTYRPNDPVEARFYDELVTDFGEQTHARLRDLKNAALRAFGHRGLSDSENSILRALKRAKVEREGRLWPLRPALAAMATVLSKRPGRNRKSHKKPPKTA